jgi:hypothetical protein
MPVSAKGKVARERVVKWVVQAKMEMINLPIPIPSCFHITGILPQPSKLQNPCARGSWNLLGTSTLQAS